MGASRMDWEDPDRIRSWQELILWIDEIGFLPLFKNDVEGFSVEEHTVDLCWWTGDPAQDPWNGAGLSPTAVRSPTASSLAKRPVFSPRRGFPTLPTGGETAMILTVDGMRDSPAHARRRLWISLQPRKNCPPLSFGHWPASAKRARKILKGP